MKESENLPLCLKTEQRSISAIVIVLKVIKNLGQRKQYVKSNGYFNSMIQKKLRKVFKVILVF